MLRNSPKSLIDSVSKIMGESKVKYDKEQTELAAAQKAVWESKLGKTKKKAEQCDEGIADTVKKVAKAAGKALTGGSDEDQLKDLQKKMGLPQTGKKPVKEEAAEEEVATEAKLDEARGRPRKNPSPEASSEDEADHNIVMHLKKSVDTAGNHDVKFGDKSTHKVPHHVATAVLGAMGKLKPADRLEVQKHIQQSHKNLMQVHGMIK